MDKRHFSIELVNPRLKSGKIVKTADQVEYHRKGRVSLFPLTSQRYLEAFASGMCIHDLIRSRLEKNEHVNFAEIKETLSVLYWNGDLENESSFSSFIELVDGPPEKTGYLADPFFEYNFGTAKLAAQLLMLTGILIMMTATIRYWMTPEASLFSVLLIPQTFISLKTFLGAFANSIFNRRYQALSLQFSPIGIYLKPSNGRPHVISSFEYLVRSIFTLALAFAAFKFFQGIPNFEGFGTIFLILSTGICFSPTHNSDLSNFRHNSAGSALSFLSTGFYFALCGTFAWLSVTLLIRLLDNGFPSNLATNIIHIATFSAVFGLIFDMLDDYESLSQKRLRYMPRRLSFKNAESLGMDNVLKEIPLLQAMPPRAFEEMARSSQVRKFKAGEIIIRGGEPSTDLFVVLRGQVGIYTRGVDGKRQRVAQLEEGTIFGEGGFLMKRPRVGDAYALKDTTVILVRRPSSIDMSERIPEFRLFQRKMWGFQTLAGSELFKETPTEVIGEMVQKSELVELQEKQIVFNQGEASDALWIVVQGTCRAIIDGKAMRDITAGEIFGEIGILKRSKRTATIVSVSSCVLLKVDSQHLWDILSCHLNLGLAIQSVARERFFSQSA